MAEVVEEFETAAKQQNNKEVEIGDCDFIWLEYWQWPQCSQRPLIPVASLRILIVVSTGHQRNQ